MERTEFFETPIYGTKEVARYVGVPYQTLRYWIRGSETVGPLIELVSLNPPQFSFYNLLECHMLSAMRGFYKLPIPKVRKALRTLQRVLPSPHPLVDREFLTDKVDLFVQALPDELINLSRDGQLGIRAVLATHLERIEQDASGLIKFYPFVEDRKPSEPKLILMSPAVGFGRPVIAGTGISTAIIAARFHARESVSELAEEYKRSSQEIEEAIRWESKQIAA